MLALEITTTIDNTGTIHLPAEYRSLYGKSARLIVLTQEPETRDFSQCSEKSLEKVWNNDEDSIYDGL
jgi:hypothetical protein